METDKVETTIHSANEDKLKEFYLKFDKYIEEKYKPSDSIVKPLSYITPVITSFIGAYGLLIECLANTIISLIKDMPICKQLATRFFIMCINFYEFFSGTKSFVINLTDENTNRMLTSSLNDLTSKIRSSYQNIYELLIENCDEIIKEKMNEFSEID